MLQSNDPNANQRDTSEEVPQRTVNPELDSDIIKACDGVTERFHLGKIDKVTALLELQANIPCSGLRLRPQVLS